MWAVIDANSYFCSVERVFHPGLRHKPVCVLSSNDGNIVALTPEAKALGIKRGDPYFKVRSIIEANHVATFSGNIMLYAAMSRRIVSIMRSSLSSCIQYSIDECFADLSGYGAHHDLVQLMRETSDRIRLWTDVPVSVGIAPSKTLAKVGSRFAKKYPGYRSVCMIDNDGKRRKALSMTDLQDIWGIGHRTYARLMSLGITTPLQFADKDIHWVRSHFTKPGLQTWMELNGQSCIDVTDDSERKTITTSRSFGQMVTTTHELREAVASFASGCANTLRGQQSVAENVSVFLCSNPFREDLPQYMNMSTARLGTPTADTLEITQAALALTGELFMPGIHYKKAGVILGGISSGAVQQNLFDSIHNRPERLSLSRAVDSMNRKYGVKSVHLAIEGDRSESWRVRCDMCSPNYLTSLDELLSID